MTDLAPAGTTIHRLDAGTRPSRARRFLRRRTFVVGLAGVVTIVSLAVLAPVLAPADPNAQDLGATLVPPIWAGGSWEHPLGTDVLGQDVASRLLYGARSSLTIAFLAVLLAASLGLMGGLTAGFSRSWWDSVLMRVGDMQLAFPFILLAIVVLGVITDRSAWHIILVLGIPGWIIYARVVRSRVLAERDKDYVTAARSIGASSSRQLRRYVLPSVWQVVLVIALLDFGFVILVESTLSFLGFGLGPRTPSWGSMLADGRRNMAVAPWLAVIPGLAIMLTVLAINLMADGAADVLDPRLRKGTFRRTRPRQQLGATAAQVGPVVSPGRVAADDPDAAGATGLPDIDEPILRIDDLHVEFPFDERTVRAVRGVSFEVRRGQTLGIVGESGSGKSVTALSIIQLLDAPGRVTGGRILFEGRDVSRIDDRAMARLRGSKIGMIFQNPAASLDPVMSVGAQLVETIRSHDRVGSSEAESRARTALIDVGIGDPDRVMRRYPFQLSGGMNQRVMIAMAMLTRPDLLIADEPTTALDVTTQAQILDQLAAITHEYDTALVLITHDIALVSEYVDEVIVMYAGRICERGPVKEVIDQPRHPYTQALLASVPRADLSTSERLTAIPGELPDPAMAIQGCPFAPRCGFVMDICRTVDPPITLDTPEHAKACHLVSLPDEHGSAA